MQVVYSIAVVLTLPLQMYPATLILERAGRKLGLVKRSDEITGMDLRGTAACALLGSPSPASALPVKDLSTL